MKPPTLPCIADEKNLEGKKVFLRASLNVPVKNGVVESTFRIKRMLPTLAFLKSAGARTILGGHIGREKGETLRPVYEVLREQLDVTWAGAVLGEDVTRGVNNLKDGDILMLENLRSHDGETVNDDVFARDLASLADLYVNDAFSVSHREHASIVGVPKYLPGYIGLTFKEEYDELTRVMQPDAPSLFILGGAKFDTKQPLIEEYREVYNHVFIGGAIANDFFKAKGYEVGVSKVSDIDLSNSPLLEDKRVLLPIDVIATKDGASRVANLDEVEGDEFIADIGPESIVMLSKYTKDAKTILWNGPLGYYEGGYGEATKACAKIVAESDAYSVVGGGDTIAVIEELGARDSFDFISTAGGAMLVFLERGTLPGIEAMRAEK